VTLGFTNGISGVPGSGVRDWEMGDEGTESNRRQGREEERGKGEGGKGGSARGKSNKDAGLGFRV
jgi:hypothetical protein